jgi:hypothetical protein
MLRPLFALALLLGPAAVVPAVVAAAPTPAPGPAAAQPAHDGGMIDGRISAVDFQKSTIVVEGGSRGRLTVTVMPSTSIQAKDGAYHTITDLKSGEHVQIFSSVSGVIYSAQIIRILP